VGYPVVEVDNDRESRPRWILWLFIFLIPIPFSPWWLTIIMLGIVATLITVALGVKARQGNSK
jgi:hypothetical protein